VLDRLLGIDTRDCVRLEVGPHVMAGRFETGRSDEERGKISAVHFPNEHARTVLSEETRGSLADDLA
jgi:hypothetical protein